MSDRNEQDDRHLWISLKKGKEKALSDLFMLYAEDLYNYGYLLCRDKALVEDCLQDLFLHLWRKRSTLSDVKKVKPYLRVSMHNRIQDAFRKTQNIYSLEDYLELEKLPTEPSVEDKWVISDHQNSQKEIVQQALNHLPERMRQAVHLRYIEGFDYADIAKIMNIRPQVATNMVYRATQKLRAYSKRFANWIPFLFVVFIL